MATLMSAGRRELEGILDLPFLEDLPLYAQVLIVIAIIVGGCIVITLSFILIARKCCRRKRQGPESKMDFVSQDFETQATSLQSVMRSNPVERDDEGSQVSFASQSSFSSSAPTSVIAGKRVSTRATGRDYGLLDAAAKNRIMSIRMDPKMLPIQARPESIAMSDFSEEEGVVNPYEEEDVHTRMQRIAEKSGGGYYNPGIATARLGPDIITGFKERRVKQDEKRKQRETMRLEAGLAGALKSDRPQPSPKPSSNKTPKKPPAPKVENKPGPNKLAAFLSAESGSSSSDVESVGSNASKPTSNRRLRGDIDVDSII
eukprot:CAMPEP_0184518824 /NCGR_PEP_ID=MMETSP0198_2-20121128/6287_1 /TAXON_ID=1112570 /ORGANISM="Thraustochytrium sp., Strain LLF1b" /LENGTH=315 /DNA_ID=CAMNT_0026909275 /DNA_START=503 /DNA_END=1450 /DNA_ORIENTATION=+